MARILVLALLTIASLLLPPVVASQQAAAKCEYRKHSGHRYRHPVGVRKIVVDAGGAGDFVSIQRARAGLRAALDGAAVRLGGGARAARPVRAHRLRLRQLPGDRHGAALRGAGHGAVLAHRLRLHLLRQRHRARRLG
ncbi:Pectinesterase [Zea mays]|uniref:Pectinesterase n=1 Tax=Zea mays TaxID=4577 RepID=A0A1D6E3V0_MAIZE|nr:Pectinesterase [Zea mays]